MIVHLQNGINPNYVFQKKKISFPVTKELVKPSPSYFSINFISLEYMQWPHPRKYIL